MIIWFIGAFFTCGLIAEEKPGFWVHIAVLFVWPLLLGMLVGDLARTFFDNISITNPATPEKVKPLKSDKNGGAEGGT